MLLPTFIKITLSVVGLGSLLFLVGALKAGKSTGKRERRLMALTGLAGLLYIGLDLYWYFYAALLQSRAIAVAYYFAWHLSGGITLGMFVYVSFQRSAKVLLAASTALLVAFNVFVIARHPTSIRLLCIGDGVFGGVLITSLPLLWFDQPKKQNQGENSESTVRAATDDSRREA
jgi:peptidoglycan/LPS O-acetylase OafA/YrhL